MLPPRELVVEQPGRGDPALFVAAARTDDAAAAVAYLPKGGSVTLDVAALKRPAAARWFDPRTGGWSSAGALTEGTQEFTAPDTRDWVLDIRAAE